MRRSLTPRTAAWSASRRDANPSATWRYGPPSAPWRGERADHLRVGVAAGHDAAAVAGATEVLRRIEREAPETPDRTGMADGGIGASRVIDARADRLRRVLDHVEPVLARERAELVDRARPPKRCTGKSARTTSPPGAPQAAVLAPAGLGEEAPHPARIEVERVALDLAEIRPCSRACDLGGARGEAVGVVTTASPGPIAAARSAR